MPSNVKNPDLRHALAILTREKNNVGAHIKAGVLYSREDKLDEAAFHLKKALSLDKKNTLILEKLADTLIKSHQYAQARKYGRKLLEMKKRDPAALHVMARVHSALGEMDKAKELIDLALERAPDHLAMLNDKAYFHSYVGELEQSLAVHRKILELNPGSPGSWWPFAQLQKFEGEFADETLVRLQLAIDSTDNNEALRGMHYACGKINQDIGRYAQAFEHIAKANLLHDFLVTPNKIIAANINIRETYSPAMFKTHKKQKDVQNSPIFILGQTRSGTTLTESLCAAHSKISAGGELVNFTSYNTDLGIYALGEKEHRAQILGVDEKKAASLASDFLLKTKHLQKPGTRLTDKMPHNFLHIGLIALVFPNAKIIHCRRHPMDNCLSIYSNPMTDYHKEYKSKLDVLGEYYRHYLQIMEYWREVCPIPIHDVYYEDLVTNTQAVARGMIDYLGLAWEDGVMTRSGSQNSVKTLSTWQVRQPIFQSSKGKWRNYEAQLGPLKEALGDCVAQYEAELAELDGSR